MSNCNQTIRTLKAGAAGIAKGTFGRSRSWGGKKPNINDYADEITEALIAREKSKYTVFGLN